MSVPNSNIFGIAVAEFFISGLAHAVFRVF